MLYALDIETSGLSRFDDQLICIGVYNLSSGYTSFSTVDEFLAWHKSTNQYILHNGKFDVNFLRHLGCDIRDSFSYCTRSIATILIPAPRLVDGQEHLYSLENLFMDLCGGSAYKVDRTRIAELSDQQVRDYNERDCRATWELFAVLVDRLGDKGFKFAEEWVMPATRFCAEMEFNGVYIDKPALLQYKLVIEKDRELALSELTQLTEEPRSAWHELQLKELKEAYQAMAQKAIVKARDKEKTKARYSTLEARARQRLEPFNFNSSHQLKWLLKDYYGLDILNKRSKKETTDEAMLRTHESRNAVCRALLRYRELEKLSGTCIPAIHDHIDADRRVHPSFHVGGTRTGRLSSSGPNFQQIPKGQIRSTIIAPEGYQLLTMDYAQIEPRILAHLAQEQKLLSSFKDGVDFYSVIASELLRVPGPVKTIKERFPKERNVCKTVGLSILYGTGAAKLQEVLQKELGLEYSINKCRNFINEYRESFSSISSYKQRLEKEASNGRVLYNLLGRPFSIEDNDDLYMKTLNTMVQGSASDLVIRAAVEIQTTFPFLKQILLVHDEMVFEIPEEYCHLIDAIERVATGDMEELLGLTVPLKVEYNIGREWSKP